MRQISINKTSAKKKSFIPDDDNVRYKLNSEFFNDTTKSMLKTTPKKQNAMEIEDDNIRYKFPTVTSKPKPVEHKPKPKAKIKVNFWSNKAARGARLTKNNSDNKRRHTIGGTPNEVATSLKAPFVKVRKRVSFLPSPIFSENHVPMVTVPDDLTIQLNEEEANDLGEDLNNAFHKSNNSGINKTSDSSKRKSFSSLVQSSPRGPKHKRSSVDFDSRYQGNENELEFFSKYVVQKLRKMETNQRIYSENLINTVLMLGQLGKLNGKSKIAEA